MVRETRHLWVANLPDNTREDRIREHFQRYGRVQSVKIIISPGTTTVPSSQPSPTGTITSTTELSANIVAIVQQHSSADHHLSSTHPSGINKCSTQHQQQPTAPSTIVGSTHVLEPSIGVNSCSNVSNNNVTSSNCVTMCAATIAFMDIKSASKAHLAEHKFEDRILTTEYYEPSVMHHGSLEGGSSIVLNSKMSGDGSTSNVVGDMKDTLTHGRFASTSSHGSSDDHSPGRTNFYDRVSTSQSGSRNTEATTEFIRRNSYHSNDIRGRQRDRHFRNNPYSLIVDRSNPISHHRLTSNTSWYETSPSSSSSRIHYNSNTTNSNNVFQQPDSSSYDRHNSSDLIDATSPSAVTTSNSNTIKDTKGLLSTQTQALITNSVEQPNAVPYKSKLLINNHHHHNLKTIKSRSGSESPISGRSSRSHSRSPSSCSSASSHETTPTSSHSSPVSGGAGEVVTHSTPSSHHHRNIKTNSTGKASTGNSHHQRHRRNLQASLSSVPIPNSIDKPASTTSSLSSSGSVSGSNPVVHSEDNRPLAICVKNLPLRSSDTSLKDGLFHEYKKHGKVTWVKVVGQSHERYALVCFKKPEDVEKALEVSQDKLFFGCKIEVQPYQGYDVDDNEFRPYEAEIDEYQSKSTRTLFIGNLEKHVTVAELRKAFEVFGEILEIDIKKQGSSPYAFCQYADIVSVVKAVRKMDGEHFGSTRIKLGFGKSMPTTCVWLDGILDGVSEHYLTQQFSRFGTVQKVAIDRDRKTALVSFDQIQCAQLAVKETRGTAIRGRKLQVDYASRECVDAFYARLEKLGVQPANINVESLITPGNNMVRHTFNASRSRASSFSRPGNPVSGATSPTSTPSAGSTPRHHSSSGSVGKKFRYAAAGSPEFYDSNEYLDTYGSGYDQERTAGGDSDHLNDGETITITSSSVRRRCDKSPGDIRLVQRVDSESGNSGITSSIRRRGERSPVEMRILESKRHQILDQLEKFPSSGDETESPKKRVKYSQEMVTDDAPNNHQNHDSSTTNCNGKVLDHRDTSSSAAAAISTYAQNHHRFHHNEMVHRKTVEIRRLSDCNIKHSASVPGGAMTSSVNYTKPNRRPSTDSLSRLQPMDSYQTMMHKRRKTSATASTSSSSSTMTLNDAEQQTAKVRSSQLNSNHSFEASGGESEHGSRPGTPLFDERPENSIDPRRPPIIGRSAEPMSLPLPKFAQQFHQQLRQNNQLLPAAHATSVAEKHEVNNVSSAHLQHSSLQNSSMSPTPQTSQVRSRSNSLMPPASSASSNSETVLTSPRPPSMVSNSSDSEQELGSISGPNSSPSLEERLKKFTEDYDSWSSNGRSSSSSHYMNSFRHSVPEIAVPETPELLKNVLKNSMFDEDSKRLENIGDKYVTQAPPTLPTATVTSKNAFGTFGVNHLPLSGTSSPMMTMMNSIGSNSSLASIPILPEVLTATSALSNSLGKLHMPAQQPVTITTIIHQRLGSSGTGSPLNSPNTASPYNSPNPSSASSISSIKGLQYPFPTHPALSTSVVTPTTGTSTISTPASTSASTSSVASTLTTTPIIAATNCQKPKTSCALGKSVSLQEVTSATGNNNNSNNFNSSCNKSSTNNNNVNNSAENPPSKLLMKSASLPNCGASVAVPMEASDLEKIEEKTASLVPVAANAEDVIKSQQEIVVKKEVELNEKKNHSKDRRKNSDNDEAPATALKEDVKEHSKKDKDSSFRKEKDSKKIREPEAEKKFDDKKSKSESKSHKKSKDEQHHHHQSIDEKKEEIVVPVERAQSPNAQRRLRRVSFEDVSSVDSASEQTTNHVENNRNSKDSKHHDGSKSNSKHHHHHNHNHKDKKVSSKEKSHGEDENQMKPKQVEVASSKDSIFDELKRNSKENIIKTSEKLHKSKKHHHHNHRENSMKDKENQTQVNNFNDTSSSVMTEDVGRSSDDEIIRHHNHNHRKEFSDDHEKRSNHEHQKNRPESSEESSGRKKYPRRSINTSLSTDDSDDSENGKNKTSFFDIPDEAPNISMYDKVKARSCKNLKKQEEEKKIKDKFSALKQSRAKRERKRINTSDDDSDSDMNDGNSNDMFQMKFRKSGLSGSDEDEKDSEGEIIRKAKSQNQFSICDDESSESGITINDGHRKRSKFISRKMSRTNVIDSTDDEMPTPNDVNHKHIEIKQEPSDFQMVTSDFDELKKLDEGHSDGAKNHNKHSSSNGSKKRHHDKNKDDKSNKKSKKLSRDLHRKSSSSIDNMQKRDEKMEDIFGPISDEDIKPEVKNNFTTALVDIKKEPIDDIKAEASTDGISKEQLREESRKRKEKRRREREKQRAIKEDENSVDLDEAGRALEAQLMSDGEQKLNNNEPTKDMKPDDVFRFTDGDDEMRRDHHDGSIKKKKKKKRAKDERKHHHNHHHYDTSIKEEVVENNLESSGAFNNNNNTKLRLDVVSNDVKPSVPLLTDSAPPTEVAVINETPAPPPPPAPTTSPTVKKEPKSKPEVVIPGFGSAVDEAVSQKAVLSIAKELEKKSTKVELIPKVDKIAEVVQTDTKASKTEAEKVEEKSRVVISQEETEDAVAALLGESFSMAIDEDYNEPCYNEDVPVIANDNDSSEGTIPPEEDEEMKNAIKSLNPDMDHKPETPQSEHELQIDTDNDDAAEEEEVASQPFDNPPKTPDVDMAQMEKVKMEPEVVKPIEVKLEKVEKIKPESAPSSSLVTVPKEDPPKEVVAVSVKEILKVEKSPEKKEVPLITRPVVPSFQTRLLPPTIIIPQESLQPQIDRISPRGAKQASPIIRSSPHLSPAVTLGNDSPNNVLNRIIISTPPTILSPSTKIGPVAITVNSLNTPASPKLLGLPIKNENKSVLIHSPVKLNSPVQQLLTIPQPNVQKPANVIAAYQMLNKDGPQQPSAIVVPKFLPVPPVEKKKIIDTKPNNVMVNALKAAVPPTQQHIIGRQPQIIYPPSTSGIIQTNIVKAPSELLKSLVDVKDNKTEQWQQNANSVIQKIDVVKDEQLKSEKKTSEMESSHDEEDFEENSPDNSMEREIGSKKGRGTGRQQRGRKTTNVQSPPAPEDPAGIQTRRGGKTPAASKRGRGGRAAATSVKTTVVPVQIAAPGTMPSPAPPTGNLMRQQKTSESDIYEFHDDSGEELAKTGDAQRPRLIMTIKSSTTTASVNTQPIITSPASSPSVPTVVQSTPISAPVIQQPTVNPIISEPAVESQLLAVQSPNPQQVPSPSPSDEFAQPNNTRKSRRLQEKDGTRTSVDDTIDDVIRNILPNQIQQANNRRATRQTATPGQPNTIVVPNMVLPQPQPLINTPVEVKKPVKANKKLKDRKISETSESETEKKLELPAATIVAAQPKQNVIQEPHIVPPQPQQQPQVPLMPIQKHPELILPPKIHQKESSELLQLIDPVTGELQKMTQSKEGQYVPVSENRIQMQKQQIPPIAASATSQVFAVEVKTEDKKILTAPAVQTVLKVTSPVVLEPLKPTPLTVTSAEPTHVIKPVITQNPTYTKPLTPKTYVLGQQSVAKTQVVTTIAPTPPTTVISSQSMMKIQHPATIYNLPNMIPNVGGKYVSQQPQAQKTIVIPPHQNQQTIIHQSQPQLMHQHQPHMVHQKIPSNGQQPQIVIHSQPHPMMQPQQQPGGNLLINIPTSSASGQSISSPRTQVKQVIQRTMPTQQISSTGPLTTVVMKAGPPHHVVQAINQDPKPQGTYIQQGTKIVQGQQDVSSIAYISGGREIIYVGANVQKQTIYPNYPNMATKYAQHQPIPSPTQTKPQQQNVQQIQQLPKIGEKVPQPSVSVTHIQMPMPHQQPQQKVYFTNSGQVLTNVPSSVTGQQAPDSHQQWTHEKMPSQQAQPQQLKSRYGSESYDEAHRAQMQSERAQLQVVQSQGQVKRSYVIEGPGPHQLPSPSQPVHHVPSSVVNQPIIPPQNKTVIGLNQTPQILTGAVASPPLKAHLTSQQPIVTGASSSRVAIPPISPKDQQHHLRHYPPEGYDESVMHGDRSAYRSQSPPPAHQTSPLTTRPPYLMTKIYHQQPSPLYMRGGPEFARLPSRIEPRELSEIEEQRGASPPLELRRTTAMPIQSPGDRITDSPMMTPHYLSPRIPQPYFYDGDALKPMPVTEPPPAHRTHAGVPPTTVFTTQPVVLQPPTNLAHLQRDREHREKDEMNSLQTKDTDGNVRYQLVYAASPAQSLVAPTTNIRPIQLTTPPIGSQVPLHADTLSRLLERYPLMWQGLLALKTEQAAVQMHFVYGNKKIAKASLPFNSDHTTPPLRIAQRMRLEQSQIEGVARKMQITDEHCVLLALPCGRDYGDVLRQTENLQVSFINYLQQKQAAGIINIADPGSQNASYVVHIFPSCEFANESLDRIAPDLMYKVANISHLLIVIATV